MLEVMKHQSTCTEQQCALMVSRACCRLWSDLKPANLIFRQACLQLKLLHQAQKCKPGCKRYAAVPLWYLPGAVSSHKLHYEIHEIHSHTYWEVGRSALQSLINAQHLHCNVSSVMHTDDALRAVSLCTLKQ